MLSDRPYMRDDYPREKTSALTWLLCAIVGAFVLEFVLFSSPATRNQLTNGVALTLRGLNEWRLWTLATYWLLHDVKNLFHVGIVVLGLYALARELAPLLGNRRLISVFAASIFLGGLVWSAIHWRYATTVVGQGDTLIGATAGVCGLLTLFACLYPNREVSFLFFFFFPVTIKPRQLALGWFVVDVFMLGFYEFRGLHAPLDYTASAHIGGMMAGWFYYRYIYQPDSALFRPRSELPLPRWLKGQAANDKDNLPPPAPPPRAETADRATLKAEVDRILDKISSEGLASLSPAEKRVLEEARSHATRR
jgi:membrane associated rhomboid family serine protease